MAAPLGLVRRLHGLQGVVSLDCAPSTALEAVLSVILGERFKGEHL